MPKPTLPFLLLLLGLGGVGVVAGCVAPSTAEKSARGEVAEIGRKLSDATSDHGSPNGPTSPGRRDDSELLVPPRTDSSEAEYVRYALYHHPAVRAAYYDWQAAVESIAPARALPDPQFTFQADVAATLLSFMPGLMFDVMPEGRRAAMAREATAESRVAYRDYVSAVLKVAGEVRKAWVELAYATDTHRLFQETISTADAAMAMAGSDYATGHGMPTFEQQVRFQNLLAQHHAHHAGVAELLTAARARFKSALGLLPGDPDPVWPDPKLARSPVLPEEELWRRVQANNDGLAKMRAMVEMTVAQIEVARKAGAPEISAGAMVETRADPTFVRPLGTMTLPVWREKIRANIAAAEARRNAAAARVTAEQLTIAADLAQMLYMIRDADRMLDYMDNHALPDLGRSIASAEAAAQSGMASPTTITEAQLMAIDMRHDRLDVLRDRENAVVDLELLTANALPAGMALVASSDRDLVRH